jgi:hypothetical protein
MALPRLAIHTTRLHLRRLVALDLAVFEDLRYDESATVPALVIAAGSTLLLGLGGWLWWFLSGFGDLAAVFAKSVVLGSAFSVALWLAWLLVVYAVIQRLSGTIVQVDQLVRAAGFAAAPLALGLLMVVPAISFGVGLVAVGAWFVLTYAAVERVTGIHGGVPLLANAAGFAVWAAGMSLLSTGANPLAPGPFLAEAIWDALASLELVRGSLG